MCSTLMNTVVKGFMGTPPHVYLPPTPGSSRRLVQPHIVTLMMIPPAFLPVPAPPTMSSRSADQGGSQRAPTTTTNSSAVDLRAYDL